jgi:hypothetical protein
MAFASMLDYIAPQTVRERVPSRLSQPRPLPPQPRERAENRARARVAQLRQEAEAKTSAELRIEFLKRTILHNDGLLADLVRTWIQDAVDFTGFRSSLQSVIVMFLFNKVTISLAAWGIGLFTASPTPDSVRDNPHACELHELLEQANAIMHVFTIPYSALAPPSLIIIDVLKTRATESPPTTPPSSPSQSLSRQPRRPDKHMDEGLFMDEIAFFLCRHFILVVLQILDELAESVGPIGLWWSELAVLVGRLNTLLLCCRPDDHIEGHREDRQHRAKLEWTQKLRQVFTKQPPSRFSCNTALLRLLDCRYPSHLRVGCHQTAGEEEGTSADGSGQAKVQKGNVVPVLRVSAKECCRTCHYLCLARRSLRETRGLLPTNCLPASDMHDDDDDDDAATWGPAHKRARSTPPSTQ